MDNKKFYVWGNILDSEESIFSDVIRVLEWEADNVNSCEEEALKEIHKYFEEDCTTSALEQQDDFIIYELNVTIKPKKIVHKKGVMKFSTETENI